MKWFRHESDSHTNVKMRMMFRKHGLAGYGLVWVCREMAAKEGNAFRVATSKDWLITLSESTKLSIEDLSPMLSYAAEIGLIDGDAYSKGDLYVPKMVEYTDDYFKRHKRVYEQYPNTQLSDVVHTVVSRNKYMKDITLVIEHLNAKTSKAYRVASKDNQIVIASRLQEGYTAKELCQVVDNMTDKWMGDEKMEQYLRPNTLFRRSHIEGYLNADKGLASSMKGWGKKNVTEVSSQAGV